MMACMTFTVTIKVRTLNQVVSLGRQGLDFMFFYSLQSVLNSAFVHSKSEILQIAMKLQIFIVLKE